MFVKKIYYINISSNVYYDNAWVNDISKIYDMYMYRFLPLICQLLFNFFQFVKNKISE